MPTTTDLIEAVSEYLQTELLPSADGADRYQIRVCVAALGIACRDIELGAGIAEEHEQLLATLGVRDDAQLADEIRGGLPPARYAQVREVLQRQVDGALTLLTRNGR